MTRTIEISELRVGDVFLHRGTSQISKLVSWVGDSPHSHAAFYDGTQIIEAGIPRVVKTDIRARAADTKNVEFIEVYRWKESAEHPHLGAVSERAHTYVGTAYDLTASLLGSVVAVLLRRKATHRLGFLDGWPAPLKRLVLDLLGRALSPDNPELMICTELVYRAFDEAAVEPTHLMRPEFVDAGPIEREWDIDTPKLIWELWSILGTSSSDPSVVGPNLVGPGAASSPDVSDIVPGVDDAALDDAVLDRLTELEARITPDDDTPTFPVNPQTVIPLDFQTSPSFVFLGLLARS